jgi:hypothetical protein
MLAEAKKQTTLFVDHCQPGVHTQKRGLRLAYLCNGKLQIYSISVAWMKQGCHAGQSFIFTGKWHLDVCREKRDEYEIKLGMSVYGVKFTKSAYCGVDGSNEKTSSTA